MAKESDEMLGELRAIKLLMILQLVRQGAKQSQIAAILGVSERTLGRMLPKGAIKGAKGGVALISDEAE